MEKTEITPHHNDCFYEARCWLLPGCCVWSGSRSLLTHYPRHEVGGPQSRTLPVVPAAYQHRQLYTPAAQSRHNSPAFRHVFGVQLAATCVPLNIISHAAACDLFCLISTFQRIVMTLQFALYLGTVSVFGMHYWRYQVT